MNLTKLNNASFFVKETLSQVLGVSESALSADLQRWITKGLLIQLKNGLYVTREYYQPLAEKQSYLEFLANILKKPSYLSGEYVMQKYGMLTESVFAITSVTRKKTNMYQNKLGAFLYSNVKDDLFTGYHIINKNGFEIKEATKAKALFDFLYLRLWRIPTITKELLESYRLNLFELSREDYEEISTYSALSGIKKFNNIPDRLEEIANDR